MTSRKTILVTGASGRQGGKVVDALLKNDFAVKGLSRTPHSIASRELVAKGVDVIKGDQADMASLISAMEGCHGVFSIQNYFESGGEKEILFGKNMADASRSCTISHFVYSSVCNAGSKTGIPHFETKYVIEQYIRQIGIPATILRPVKFMENYYIPQVFKGILGGKLFDPIPASHKHQMIAAEDIGKYALEVFQHPERYINKTIELAGDELTNEEVAGIMEEVLGSPVKFKRLPLLIAKLLMDKELYLMFRWFVKRGFSADLKTAGGLFPTVRPLSLKEFLIKENWHRWNKKGSV